MLRGGSWVNGGYWLRCSYRDWYVPGWRVDLIGFRLVRFPSH
ncbi:hypothetical protein EH223_12805 [candidate division KSB1 bacterium]|nr:hypothetical protein [candidate division KSB1 bacterium]RQW02362.1 MAG: hypothetical protein EH223_12805 [candidate division KSB1 bacterium]